MKLSYIFKKAWGKKAVLQHFGTMTLQGGEKIFVGLPNRRGGIQLFVKKTGNYFEILTLKRNKIFGAGLDGFFVWDSSYKEKKTFNDLKSLSEEAESQNLLREYKKLKLVDAFKFLTQKENIPPSSIIWFMPDIEQESVGQKIRNFNLHFDENNKKEKTQIEDLIEKVLSAFEGWGFSKFLYGDIYVVSKLRGRAVADYVFDDDAIRLSKKAKKDDLRTLIHEIGHRIYHKGGVDKDKIRAKYREALLQGWTLEIKPNTVVKLKKTGEPYVYLGKIFSGREIEYKLAAVSEENLSKFINGTDVHLNVKYYKASPFFFKHLEGDFKFETTWLPTSYSRTNEQEWFCEILSFALTGTDPQLREFIKEIRK